MERKRKHRNPRLKMNNYKELCYWNTNTYGKAIIIKSNWLKTINTLLSMVIVGLYPVPVALIINKYIKDYKVRY